MFAPPGHHQTDDRHDTGEPVICCDCGEAVAVPDTGGRCSTCYTNAGEAQDESDLRIRHRG